jgi:hypothetical protein
LRRRLPRARGSAGAGQPHPGKRICARAKADRIDAAIWIVANIYFYEIETPLRHFVVAYGHIVRYCRAIHDAVMAKQT